MTPGTRAGSLWSIVLAGGEGTRLRPFVRKRFGSDSPKQFIAFTGARSMLEHTIHRAEMLVPPERVISVLSPQHGREVDAQLGTRPEGTVIFQPRGRDTAPGILLPLVHILKRDPGASVVILPSDHFILEEGRFARQLRATVGALRSLPEEVILIGIEPDSPEPEYGWIEPGETIHRSPVAKILRVRSFQEKPTPHEAREFFQKGYLWNSLVTVARADALLELIRRGVPRIVERFERIRRSIGRLHYDSIVAQEYRSLPRANISREVFERFPHDISVMPLRKVSWSDWGSASRIEKSLSDLGKQPAWPPSGPKMPHPTHG